MQFDEMGSKTGKVLFLLPGTACDYQTNFGSVLDKLGEKYHLVCVNYDGFDGSDSIFPDMLTIWMILVPLAMIVFVNGARSWWDCCWQYYVLFLGADFFDWLVIDTIWVALSDWWLIPGTEDLNDTWHSTRVKRWKMVKLIPASVPIAAIVGGLCWLASLIQYPTNSGRAAKCPYSSLRGPYRARGPLWGRALPGGAAAIRFLRLETDPHPVGSHAHMAPLLRFEMTDVQAFCITPFVHAVSSRQETDNA